MLVVLLVAAQLALPALAERRLRHDLERYGEVDHVAIRAFPALKLLWHRADRVTVAMRDYRSPRGPIGDFLVRTRATGDLDVHVGTLRSGPVVLRDARVTKRGDALTGSARLEQADLRRALPPELDVRPVAAGGQGIVLQGTASALGVGVQAEVRLRAAGGAVVVAPEGPSDRRASRSSPIPESRSGPWGRASRAARRSSGRAPSSGNPAARVQHPA